MDEVLFTYQLLVLPTLAAAHFDSPVIQEAVHLIPWNTQSMPVEYRIPQKYLDQNLIQQDRSKSFVPNALLLGSGASFYEAFDIA